MVRRYNFQEVIDIFNENDCILLETSYKNNSTKMKYICSCGNKSEISLNKFLSGQRCKLCRNQKISESRKFTIEQVQEKLIELNQPFEVLEERFTDSHTKMKYKCILCDGVYYANYNNLKKMNGCPNCSKEIAKSKLKHSYDYVYSYFKEHGCLLLSKTYKNSNQNLDYICECGNKSIISFSSFNSGKRCKECMKEKLRKERQFSYEYVRNYFLQNNCELLENNYINNKTEMKYRCECGNISYITFENFKAGQRCFNCRNKKIGESLRGREFPERRRENHPKWNHDKTDEERLQDRKYPEYHDWRKQVFERDNYTCQCCGSFGSSLAAHHKDGYHWCEEKRLDVDNGTTLCNDCHNEFHFIYGKSGNTKEQFIEFQENFISDIISNC